MDAWFYELDGTKNGPVDSKTISGLHLNGTLTDNTLLWRTGYPEWKPFSETELHAEIEAPPALPTTRVKNLTAWNIAFAPLIGGLLQGLVALLSGIEPMKLWFVPVLWNIILCAIDFSELKKHGVSGRLSQGWAFLVPVYLWKRQTILRQPKHIFWVWMCWFLIPVIWGIVT